MKKKAYNPALNNKFFLGLWFVLFAALILLVNWLFTRPLHQMDDLNSRLASTDKQITRLKALHAEFLLSQDKGDNLFITSESTAEQEATSLLSTIGQDLDHYTNIRFLARKPEAETSLREFSNTLAGVKNSLTDFFLVSRERGNAHSGLVSRWQALSDQMLAVSNPPGNDILQKLNLLKQSESIYLLQRDPRILELISLLCEEIRNQLIPEEGGIDLADLDAYVTLTGNLIALDKRIGTSDTGGIVADLTASLEKLPAVFETTKLLVNEIDAKRRIWWPLLQLLTVLLILSSSVFLFIRITNHQVFQPLKQLAGFTQKLATGELPEATILPGKIPDIRSIKDSLEKLVSDLKEKIFITRALHENKQDINLVLAGENDLLGKELMALQEQIQENARKQLKNDEEAQKRRYINEGLAKFAEILRSGSNDIHALGDAFIREIVKYLNAIQGGFFIYDDTEKSTPVLKMVSAFAYNRKKYLQKTVAFGEGLVGTCAREKQSINLTEIPPGYISITSGLGETLPDNLLLVPVLHENELIGVLEIASLQKYKDHEITFAEEVAHSLGSTIIYTRNNQRTSELLVKSQQQALEMAEQEEEMRQNMEELKATQEESNRREEEYKGIADAINHALFIIEYDLDGIIREVNERFCIFMGRSREDMIGHLHHEIMGSTLKPDLNFWDELQKNNQHTFIEPVKVGKKTFRLLEHFTAIQNRDGIIVKFINFATNDRTGNS